MSLIKKNTMLFPSLMNEFLRPDWFGGMENLNIALPAINIKENELDFELELFVPGRKKEDFAIEIDDAVLTVSAEAKDEKSDEGVSYTRREFRYTSFKRSFSLPETIDEDKINASYVNGVLRFKLPKLEEALPKPKRMIELS